MILHAVCDLSQYKSRFEDLDMGLGMSKPLNLYLIASKNLIKNTICTFI